MKLIEKNLPTNVSIKVIYDREGVQKRIVRTHAVLLDGDRLLGVGTATANANEPSPSKKVGRAIAIGRAMKRAGFTR